MSIIEELPELSGLDPLGLAELARGALRRLGDTSLWSLSDNDALELVKKVGAALAAGESARFAAVREVDSRGAAIAAGSASTAAWLRAETRERPGSAKRSVAVARGLADRYPATAAALADGVISADHARVICRVLDGLPSTVSAGEVAEAEQTLLAHAAGYDPHTLAKLGEHLAYVLDPDGDKALAAYEARLEAGRELFLSQLDNGYWEIRGRLDQVAGAQLWTLIESLSAPRPSTEEGPDPRTAAQRRADALVEACELLLESDELPTQGGSATTLVVTTTVETLEGRLGGPAATVPGGAPISIGSLRLLACDAKVIAMMLGADSQPLDVGRTRRTVPPHLRHAMLVRDGHRCVIPGCGARPRVAHHIVPWENLGETKLDNLASLCAWHHRWIHLGREQAITPVPGGRPIVNLGRGP